MEHDKDNDKVNDEDNSLKLLTKLQGGVLTLTPVKSHKLWKNVDLSLLPDGFQVLLNSEKVSDFNSLRKIRVNGLTLHIDGYDVDVLHNFYEAMMCLLIVATCVKDNMEVVAIDLKKVSSMESQALLQKQILILSNQAELLAKYFWFLNDSRNKASYYMPGCIKSKIDWILAKMKDDSLNAEKKFIILVVATHMFISEAMDCANEMISKFECLKECWIFDKVESHFTTCENISKTVLQEFCYQSHFRYVSQVICEAQKLELVFRTRILSFDSLSYLHPDRVAMIAGRLVETIGDNLLKKGNIEDNNYDVNPGEGGNAVGRTPDEEHEDTSEGGNTVGRTPDEEHEDTSEGGNTVGWTSDEEHEDTSEGGNTVGRTPDEEHEDTSEGGNTVGWTSDEEHEDTSEGGNAVGRTPDEEHEDTSEGGNAVGRTPDEGNEDTSEGGSQNSQRRLKRNLEAMDYPDAKRRCQPRSGRGTR